MAPPHRRQALGHASDVFFRRDAGLVGLVQVKAIELSSGCEVASTGRSNLIEHRVEPSIVTQHGTQTKVACTFVR